MESASPQDDQLRTRHLALSQALGIVLVGLAVVAATLGELSYLLQ